MLMIVQAPKEPRDSEPRWKRQAPEILPTEHVPVIVTMRSPARPAGPKPEPKGKQMQPAIRWRIV